MPTGAVAKNTEAAIWARLIQPGTDLLSTEAARFLLALRFSETDLTRMHELAARNGEGRLTSEEKEELSGYLKIGDLLAIFHSRARQALKKAGAPRNGHG